MLSVQPNMAAVALSDFFAVVYDYLNLVLPVNAAGVYFGIARLRADARETARRDGRRRRVDAALSVASLRAGQAGWTRPSLHSPGVDRWR